MENKMYNYLFTSVKVLILSYAMFYFVCNDLFTSVVLSTVLYIVFLAANIPSWKLEDIIKKAQVKIEEEEASLIPLRDANETLAKMKVGLLRLKSEHKERSELLIDKQATLEAVIRERDGHLINVSLLQGSVVDLEAQNNKLRTQVQEQMSMIKDLSEQAKRGEEVVNKVKLDNLRRSLAQTPKDKTEKIQSIKRQMMDCGVSETQFNEMLSNAK